MARLHRSLIAKTDLLEIWIRAAERSGLARADALAVELEEAIKLVALHPGAGAIRDDLLPGLRSFPVHAFPIFYRPLGKEVELVRVIRGARDLRSLFLPRRRRR